MKLKFILLLILLNCSIAYGQDLTGKIVDVLDGRTVVIESSDKNRFAIQLQFIEVPTAETSFAPTGKEHLKKLSINKPASFSIIKIVEKVNIGKVLVGGVDLSQQLLLDGTAWYLLPEKDEQKYGERNIYLELEQTAKAGQRGVWADISLKPSWIIQAEKDAEKEKQRVREMQEENSRLAAERQKKRDQANANVQMWAEVPDVTGTGGCVNKYDKYADITQCGTLLMRLNVKNPRPKSEISLGVTKAFYGQDIKKTTGFSYFLTFKCYSLLTTCSGVSDLRLVVGNQRIHLQDPKYNSQTTNEQDEDTGWHYTAEFARFQMNEDQFKAFSQQKTVEFKLGHIEGVIDSWQMATIKNLLN